MMARPTLLLLLLLAACGDRYYVNETAETIPNLYLREVRLRDSGTTLVFRYETDQPCEIGVPPPGDPEAFVLRAGDKILKMTGASGIAAFPEKTPIGAYESLKFELTFEPLPEGTKEFALGKPGFDPSLPSPAWRFGRIDLEGRNVVGRWCGLRPDQGLREPVTPPRSS
jgi:hypothetical protein